MRGGNGQRYEGGKYEIDTQKRKPRFTEAKENIQCHVEVRSLDGDGGGEGDCPIPILNPLTKLRNGRSSQFSAPEGTSVLARVRGRVSDSPSSDSRCRFLPAPAKPAPSTAVASVEATDNWGQFSDLSERLGLPSEVLARVPSVCTAACSL